MNHWFRSSPVAPGIAIVVGIIASAFSCVAYDFSGMAAAQERTLLDAGWLFHRGDVPETHAAVTNGFDDRAWQTVHLPHDYQLDDPEFSPSNPRSQGYLAYTPGWYRKHLAIPAGDRGKVLRLDFDGVFRQCDVWLNGTRLGQHLSGYTPFSFDVSAIAQPGADNVIAVRVDPREFEGWWYEGGGIYRHVYLTALSPVHVAQWGTYVVSVVPKGEQGAADEADLTIQTTVENSGNGGAKFSVLSEILGPDGNVLLTIGAQDEVAAASKHDVVQHAVLPHPKLWSIESPNLYQLHTTILQGGKTVDEAKTTFGVRTIHYDGARGFFLNGKHIEIQGLCNHQDLSAFGIAVPDNLESWRVAQEQKSGCNAWRTAHNPPDESLLDACDHLGMMVMDENRHLGDTYRHHTQSGTLYSSLSDLATMIQRDRNHPSIIMWSMCNEEPLQGSQEGATIFTAMMKVVHQYDTTRPITSAMVGGFNGYGDADVEDIIGVNYNSEAYDKIHMRRPTKPMFGSEDTNQKTTRGQYADDRPAGMSSAYNLSARGWLDVATRPFMCGSFTWTGFDYRGEPNPFGWPDVSNNTGLLDLCGFPKDKFYYFQSRWTDRPMVHLLPDNWNAGNNAGRNVRVIAFSNAKQVELFLNNRSLGARDVGGDSYAEWQVPYQPGHLVAVATDDGKPVAAEDLATTGEPAAIQVEPFGPALTANGEDAAVVRVSIVDKDGKVVPDSVNQIHVELAGRGSLAGIGNGNPADHTPDRAPQKAVFHGHCAVFVRAGTESGAIKVTVSSPGLAPASTLVEVR
jgi:beta-galactosidase